MRRPALYSRSERAAAAAPLAAPPAPPTRTRRLLAWRPSPSDPRTLWGVILLLGVLVIISLALALRPGPRKLTQDDIDAAVLKTLETTTLPSAAARAAEAIRPSLVRVAGYVKKSRLKELKPESKDPKDSRGGQGKGKPAQSKDPKADEDEEVEYGTGSGVVIVDKGVILTNLHVVQGADRIVVTFSDGLTATATITGVQPENDLAVLQASKIPDDLIAATMRSTADLQPGDEVVAVGFPFGIGPSVSAGVVSGLKRSFRSPEGKQDINNLIQFDAAANPGNSGGPLVTMDGEVVGIVTAIYNPTSARTFLGIGFAVPIENAASAVGLHPF